MSQTLKEMSYLYYGREAFTPSTTAFARTEQIPKAVACFPRTKEVS
jgi:hypothetical protein